MLSVMMSHLNTFLWELNPFGSNLFMFGWDFIDSDNFEFQIKGFKVSIRLSNFNFQVNLFIMNSIEIIHAPREIG